MEVVVLAPLEDRARGAARRRGADGGARDPRAAEDAAVRMDCAHKPEFDYWQWVTFWYPLTQVVDFKRDVYRRALAELAPHLPVRR